MLLQTSTTVPPVLLDSSKLCHCLRRKLAEDKNLLQEIEKFNGLVLDSATNIDLAVVEHSLTGESTVSQIWLWEVHGSGTSVFRCFTQRERCNSDTAFQTTPQQMDTYTQRLCDKVMLKYLFWQVFW